MLGHVYRLVGLEVPQLARLVTRGSQDLGAILGYVWEGQPEKI